MAVSRSAICKRRQIHAVFNLLIYQLQIIFPKLLPDVSVLTNKTEAQTPFSKCS